MTDSQPSSNPPSVATAVLDSSHDGIMAFDSVRNTEGVIEDFRWTIVNRAAESVVGHTADDLIGDLLLSVMPGNREDGLFDRYVEVVETGESSTVEHHYEHEGLNHWFLTTAVPLGEGFAVTFRDVSAQKRLEFELVALTTADPMTGLLNRLGLTTRSRSTSPRPAGLRSA